MKDEGKTKKQLIGELSALRQRVAQLEGAEGITIREEHYRSMVEASPVAIMAIRNGSFIFVNPAGARMLGFPYPEEMLGMSALDVVAPESKAEIAERIQRLEEGKDNPLTQVALIRRDGTRIIAESTSVSISIGGIPTAVIIAQDISDRKKQEEKLQVMQFSIDHALDRIAWIAPEGRILYANQAACKEMGYTLEEVLPMSVPDIDPNFPIEKWREHYQEVKKNGSIRLETQQISEDGQTHDIDVSTNYLKFGGHEFLCTFARDITERKRAELKLKESEERFRSFMDNNPAAIYIKDECGRHIYGNRAILNLTGMQLEEFIGTTSHDFFPRDIAVRLEAADQDVRDSNTKREVDEYVETIGGNSTWRREIKFPIQVAPDKTFVGGVAIDITDRKRAEEKLERALSEVEELKDRMELENIYLRKEIKASQHQERIIGQSNAIRNVLGQAERVAETNSSVLILGETGTGKELLAHVIHEMSSRKKRPMVKVNCAALPATLMENELFGREKGAYTGALSRQAGRFEVAHDSTIFLDEVSELSPGLQAKLLRVLQDGKFERLGSSKTISVDVRVIAATNQDLTKLVEQGRFREDLYYRLNVFPITMPPLRERPEDIPSLVWAFVQEFQEAMAKSIDTIPRKSMEALQMYSWPGNVRELKNVVERSMILAEGPSLRIDVPWTGTSASQRNLTLQAMERRHIHKALERTDWRISGKNGAAELLGLKPTTLRSRMEKLGIRRPK